MFDLEKLKGATIQPGYIIWNADRVPRAKLSAVVAAGLLPEGTILKLSSAFFEDDRDVQEFMNFCKGHGYPAILEVNLPELDPEAITPKEAVDAEAAGIVVDEPLTGSGDEESLLDVIGPRYGRLIENIQLGR